MVTASTEGRGGSVRNGGGGRTQTDGPQDEGDAGVGGVEGVEEIVSGVGDYRDSGGALRDCHHEQVAGLAVALDLA